MLRILRALYWRTRSLPVLGPLAEKLRDFVVQRPHRKSAGKIMQAQLEAHSAAIAGLRDAAARFEAFQSRLEGSAHAVDPPAAIRLVIRETAGDAQGPGLEIRQSDAGGPSLDWDDLAAKVEYRGKYGSVSAGPLSAFSYDDVSGRILPLLGSFLATGGRLILVERDIDAVLLACSKGELAPGDLEQELLNGAGRRSVLARSTWTHLLSGQGLTEVATAARGRFEYSLTARKP